MSVLLIIFLAFLIASSIGAIFGLIVALVDWDGDWTIKVCVVIILAVFVAGSFIGIGINTDSEKVYLAEYSAQKTTIEQSLKSDTITGFERVELVKQASELNGEVSARKAKYDLWHYVCYDGNPFEDVELIDLSGGGENG